MTVFRLEEDAAAGDRPNEGSGYRSKDSDAITGKRNHSFGMTSVIQKIDGPNIARCFLRLANLDGGVFERLGRYEAALWRQLRQTLFTLESLRWRVSHGRHPRRQRPWHRSDAG
jgi:hypothetical protein